MNHTPPCRTSSVFGSSKSPVRLELTLENYFPSSARLIIIGKSLSIVATLPSSFPTRFLLLLFIVPAMELA